MLPRRGMAGQRSAYSTFQVSNANRCFLSDIAPVYALSTAYQRSHCFTCSPTLAIFRFAFFTVCWM